MPKTVTVTARLGREDDAPSHTFSYELGEDAAENIKMFTAEVVNSKFEAAVAIDKQAIARAGLKAEKKPAEINKMLEDHKIGVRRATVSKRDKVKADIAKMTPEERKALLAEIAKDAA